MPTYSVNISWQDRLLQSSSNSFEVNDAASAVTLASGLRNYTHAGIKGLSIIEKKLPSEIGVERMTPDPTGEYATVDQKAVLSFFDASTGSSHTWELPAPKDGMFEDVPRVGKRITKEWGDMIAATLSNELGITLTYVEGWLKSDK